MTYENDCYKATKKHYPTDLMYRVQLWRKKQTNLIPVRPLDFLACAPLLTFLLFKHKHYTVLPGKDLQAIFISSSFYLLLTTLALYQTEKRGLIVNFYCSHVRKTPEKERVTTGGSDPKLALILSLILSLSMASLVPVRHSLRRSYSWSEQLPVQSA